MSESEKSQRIAEAKTVIALCYFEMLRYVGGVTWIDHYVDVNEEMNFPRITFAQTVEKIVALLDEVINSNLKWKQDDADDGRMTKAPAPLSTLTRNGIPKRTNIPATVTIAPSVGKLQRQQAMLSLRKCKDKADTR